MSTHATLTITYPNGNGEVTLYQHADGYDLAGTIARALDRGRSRWHDPSYLARIIFSEMVADDIDGTMGYGILPGRPEWDAECHYELDADLATISGGGWTAASYQEFIVGEIGSSRRHPVWLPSRPEDREPLETPLGEEIDGGALVE